MNKRFEVFYYLRGEAISLIEIKRVDLGEVEDLSRIYHWLLLNNQTQQLRRLEFRAMHSQPDQQERTFAQGHLQFNQTSGNFQELASGHQHPLRMQPTDQVPASLLALVNLYLDGVQ